MSNTVEYGDGIICIANIDENWLWTSIVSGTIKTMRIDSIQFNPGAADDVCIFKSRSVTGPIFFDVKCSRIHHINVALGVYDDAVYL